MLLFSSIKSSELNEILYIKKMTIFTKKKLNNFLFYNFELILMNENFLLKLIDVVYFSQNGPWIRKFGNICSICIHRTGRIHHNLKIWHRATSNRME